MLDLFICHLNPSAMRCLAQKLEEEGLDSELRRYCERILRVRSTGWTQGIFANFAAESMVPKGPEWGGGNWEIKTPANLNSVPQWELAGEVMSYMKTGDGTIPAIITDHIGVYLGSIKGRGNVVEVREDSLVKAFIPAGDNKPNGLPNSLAKSISNKSNGLPAGHVKLDALMVWKLLLNTQVPLLPINRQKQKRNSRKRCMEVLLMVAAVMRKECQKQRSCKLEFGISQFHLLQWMSTRSKKLQGSLNLVMV